MKRVFAGDGTDATFLTRGALLACLITIFAVDAYLWITSPPLLLDGLTDWAAHLSTALLLLAVLPRQTSTFIVGTLLGSVVIDLDHLPQYLGPNLLTEGTPRPYTHSLLTLLVVIFAALCASGKPRVFLIGGAVGLTTHLIRDMAEPGQNAGVALFWPFSDWGVAIPYAVYAAIVISMFVVAWRERRPRRGPSTGG